MPKFKSRHRFTSVANLYLGRLEPPKMQSDATQRRVDKVCDRMHADRNVFLRHLYDRIRFPPCILIYLNDLRDCSFPPVQNVDDNCCTGQYSCNYKRGNALVKLTLSHSMI